MDNKIALNKKAKFDYELLKPFEAGIVLKGWEIKSLRKKEVSIKDAFVIIKKNEAFIINMNITPYKFGNNKFVNLKSDRTRKLLLNKKEINQIEKDIKLQKIVVIPYLIYLKNNFAKLKIYTAKPKKKYDKRETIKKQDQIRDIEKYIKKNK